MSTDQTANQTEALLDLALPRTVALVDRGHSFILECRRITDADWTEFFGGSTITSENTANGRIDVVETETPFIRLAEAVLVGARGYAVVGGGDLCSLPDWQKKIPLGHRRQLGYTLADARPSAKDDDELLIYPDGEVISLDATWSAANTVEGADVVMMKYSGLKHLLKTPTEAKYRRYASESTRRRVIGGSRSGKTVYQGASVLLAKLYDELIQSVDGYCVNGVKLSTPEQIVREMDMQHKVMAAQEIFQPQTTVKLAGVDER
jgi:hypothetical protein